MTETRSACCYCGVGCGVIVETRDGRISGVRGDPEHPANFGRLCTKGTTLHLTAHGYGRALYPELRSGRASPRTRHRWDETLDHLADRFADTIRTHGPDSVGFYVSGQLLTEDYYVFNKLAKGLIGTNNIDTNSRLCMSSAVAGYKQTLGADAPPACYEDIDHADLLLIAGSNTAWAHPVLYRRIEAAKERNPALKIIVVDPRRTETAEGADLHLALLPGTDVALFNGMLHILIWEDLTATDYIAAHTEGFAALKATVRDYTPKFVAEACGINETELFQAARWFAAAKAALSLYCQGLNQSTSGTAKNAALINLHLASGQIGRPGAGPFSLTGQPNAMGGREVGGMANLLSAHRDLANPRHRAEVAALWGVDAVPATPGKTAVEMFDAVRRGEIKLLWIACTNPAQSMPDQALVREALERAELVVVQEAYANTETCAYADVLLPASSWGEKEGTLTNSERRIMRVRAAVRAPGEARDDWAIAVDFARRLEARLSSAHYARTETLFPYSTPEQIFDEHRATTRGRDLDITGMSYALLDRSGPQQWPFPEGAESGQKRLYTDGVFATASGRARFANTTYRPVADPVDARFPFRLNTGRLRDHWHAMSRTGTVAQLFNHTESPRVALNPHDLARRGLVDGELVRVASRRGSVILPVEASDRMRSGQAFIPMHWGSNFLSGSGAGNQGSGVNALTNPAFDPDSKQPELKHAAVRIERAGLHWPLVAFGFAPDGKALPLLERLRERLSAFAFASCTLIGREPAGVLFHAASEQPLAPELLGRLDALFGLDGDPVLRYDDARRGTSRRIRIDDGRVTAVRLAGDTQAAAWLKDWLVRGESVAALGRLLLSPTVAAPAGFATRGRIVCNCWNVSQSEIGEFVAALPDVDRVRDTSALDALQAALKCGTQCGSCLPEIRRMVSLRKRARLAA
ncbi:MAG TPA: molybdopterin-dependent oxidoreductase [Casimicrobiaceae bacterium]